MKHPRLIVFLFFAAFFLIGGYLLLSAQGLFLDWQTFRIIKTGGIFLNYFPKDAQLIIDGKIYETSSFFLNTGNLIKKIKPGSYELTLTKEKFRDWKKSFEVKPGLVAEFKRINLIKKEVKSQAVTAAAVKNFWLTAKGPVYQNTKDQLYFGDLRLLGEAIGAADPQSSLLATKANDDFFLTDLNKPKTTINLSRLFNSLKQRQLSLPGQVAIKKIFLNPSSNNKIIIATQQAIYEIDLKQVGIKKLLTADFSEIIHINQENIFLKNRNEPLRLFDTVSQKEKEIKIDSFGIKTIKTSGKNKQIGILDSQKRFYLRDNEKEKIAELFSGRAFADFQFSPDGLYLALVAENNEILVFNFKEEITAAVDSPEKPIRKIAWLDGLPHYIVIQKGNSVSVKDVFGQTTFNEYPIIEEISRFESSGKTIYALTIGQTLLKIEF